MSGITNAIIGNFNWLNSVYRKTERTTTDATATVIDTIPIGADSTILILAMITGIESGGANSAGFLYATFWNKDGTSAPVLVGSFPTSLANEKNDSAWGTEPTFVANGVNAIDIKVTGKAATTINWKCLTIIINMSI